MYTHEPFFTGAGLSEEAAATAAGFRVACTTAVGALTFSAAAVAVIYIAKEGHGGELR